MYLIHKIMYSYPEISIRFASVHMNFVFKIFQYTSKGKIIQWEI